MQSACEPVSAPNSLLTGKITGNFAESGHPSQFSCPINPRIQPLTAEFPAQSNREFLNAYQGNLDCTPGGEQGLGKRPLFARLFCACRTRSVLTGLFCR